MKFFECKVELFDEEAENNTGVWFGYVCAENYSEAAKRRFFTFTQLRYVLIILCNAERASRENQSGRGVPLFSSDDEKNRLAAKK